jgi:hypothetical protein
LQGYIFGVGFFVFIKIDKADAGYLAGYFDFSDRGHPGWIGGAMDWRRSASQLRELDVVGGTYSFSTRGPVLPVLRSSSNLQLVLSGGTLRAPVTQLATMTAFSTVSIGAPNPYRLSINIDRQGGGFSGSFVFPGSRAAVPFFGVLRQDEGVGTGIFVPLAVGGSVNAGTVRLVPVSAPAR